jgi:hypothetical protein
MIRHHPHCCNAPRQDLLIAFLHAIASITTASFAGLGLLDVANGYVCLTWTGLAVEHCMSCTWRLFRGANNMSSCGTLVCVA